MDKRSILRDVTFGHRVAEEETDELATYFVETDHWNRIYRGDIDIVYGPKGAGKSALYALLLSRSGQLFDRNILLIGAENPRGAPAFRDLVNDPPATEKEFVGLWKLYFASLLHSLLAEFSIANDASRQLGNALEREGLVKGTLSLSGLLLGVVRYVRRALNPQAIQGTLEVDPHTQLPKGFTGKIIFAEPDSAAAEHQYQSVDKLLELADQAFRTANLTAWILLDRLDVAFVDDNQLEANALRALFRVYLDLAVHRNVVLKIFLRDDIWTRIIAGGFREASHITRSLTLNWDRDSLLNLIVRRAVHNTAIRNAYGVTVDTGTAAVAAQEEFFYRLCPRQVDIGERKPTTIDWLLTRTADGTRLNAPRELIHFLNVLREVQARSLEVGGAEPEGEALFARSSFKEALPEVSRVRLEQTLYAEYPEYKPWLEKLDGEKTRHTPATLAVIWGVSAETAAARAGKLVTAGFFELAGSKATPEYWVPFLYRDALNLVQGAAE